MTKCYFCSRKAGQPLEDWNKPGIFSYYCEEHVQLAKNVNRKEEDQFYEYYIDESTRSWLSDSQKKLWEKIHVKRGY